MSRPPTCSRSIAPPFAVVGHVIWAGHEQSSELTALDERSWKATHYQPGSVSGGATSLVAVGNALWVSYKGGQVLRVRSGEDMRPVTVSTSLSAVAGDAKAVWATSDADRSVVRVDPESLDVVARIDVGGVASGVAVASDGSIWVTVSE